MIIHIAPWSNDPPSPLREPGLLLLFSLFPLMCSSSVQGYVAVQDCSAGRWCSIIVLQYRFTPIYPQKRENFSQRQTSLHEGRSEEEKTALHRTAGDSLGVCFAHGCPYVNATAVYVGSCGGKRKRGPPPEKNLPCCLHSAVWCGDHRY